MQVDSRHYKIPLIRNAPSRKPSIAVLFPLDNNFPPPAFFHPQTCFYLVHTLEWRHGLALGLVEGVRNDGTVTEFYLAVRLLLEGQGVLHPVVVVTVRVILTGVSAAGLFAVGSRDGSLSAEMYV